MDKIFMVAQQIRSANASNLLLICVKYVFFPAPINTAQKKSVSNYSKLTPKNVHATLNQSYPGFTLVELLVTLCVLAILLTILIPAFRTMMLNSRLNSNTDALVSTLNYARSTALHDAVNTKVCPLGAPGSIVCGADWSSGWIVVTQPDSGTGILLKSQQSTTLDPVLSANVAEVIFDTHGLATTQSNFKICDDRGASFARSVEVLATGFVQSGDTPGQAVWNNSTLTCP